MTNGNLQEDWWQVRILAAGQKDIGPITIKDTFDLAGIIFLLQIESPQRCTEALFPMETLKQLTGNPVRALVSNII